MVDAKVMSLEDVRLNKNSLLAKIPVIFIILGIGLFIYWATFLNIDKSKALFGYLFGFTVVLTLALGCLSFVLIQHVTRAGWSVVVRRVPETAIALMPIFILFFIPIILNLHDIFPWTHHDHIDETLAKKLPYLNENFFLIRSFGYLLSWAVLGVWFYVVSIRQDESKKPELTERMQAVSGPAIIVFGLTLTFASFDWLMSLQPHWYSTIFGVYFFSGSHLFGFAFITLMAMILQKSGVLKTAITEEHYHDLGKLLFGFTVFWAYISFSQFMLYWYGAIPEEIEFYTHRMTHGFETLSWAMPIIHFFVPFFLLMSRTLKRIKPILAFNCLYIIAVHLIDMYWLILPNRPHPHCALEITEVLGVSSLFFIFLGLFLFLLSRRSVLAKGDPRLSESLAFENF